MRFPHRQKVYNLTGKQRFKCRDKIQQDPQRGSSRTTGVWAGF